MVNEIAATSDAVRMPTIDLSIVLEPSVSGGFAKYKDEIHVPASSNVTRVVLSAEVAGGSRFKSDEYMATVRRRSAGVLQEKIKALEREQGREDFEICAFPIHEYIVEFLRKISEVPREGNCREVLRMIRDAVTDGGWVRLRDGNVRQHIVSCLESLRTREYVETADVKECRSILQRCSVFRMPQLNVELLFESECLG